MPNRIDLNEDLVVARYRKMGSLRKVSMSFGVSIRPICRILSKRKICLGSSVKYHADLSYFKNIDSEEKAYWLGFLYADGYVRIRRGSAEVKLKIHKKDKCMLDWLNKSLKSNYPIKREKGTNCYYLSISRASIAHDLVRIGCTQQKSLTLRFPEWLREDLCHHFIRGYFDGDGCISINNPVVNFVGSFEFTKALQEILMKECFLNRVRIKPSGRAYELAYGGRLQALKIAEYLYNNATIFLSRKKARFEKISVVPKRYTSKYHGVGIQGNKWRARVSVDGRQIAIGRFDTEEEAATAVKSYVQHRVPAIFQKARAA